MTDKELLILAAKAAGIPGTFQRLDDGHNPVFKGIAEPGSFHLDWWNPLSDDGGALRLAVKLRLVVNTGALFSEESVVTGEHRLDGRPKISVLEKHTDTADSCAATRRAIVRAAADIGRSM